MFNLLVSTFDLFSKLSKRKIIRRQNNPENWVFGHLRCVKNNTWSGLNRCKPHGKVPTTAEKTQNKEMAKFTSLLTLWDPLKLDTISNYFKSLGSGNDLWNVKEGISILQLVSRTGSLLNKPPAETLCGAKQHQFSECWFVWVPLLSSQSKIKYAISQQHEDITFSKYPF